jgi:rhamnulokinase
VGREALHAAAGIQHQRLNTVFQLAAEPLDRLAAASRLLMVPDLLAHPLTGVTSAEVTNASTSGPLDPVARAWDDELLAARTGLRAGTPVVAVGSHDTASAVVAVPAARDDFVYVSSGTWSLVGLELTAPVRTDAARAANATNELGVDGTVRLLRNTTGLWPLTECQRAPVRSPAASSTASPWPPAARCGPWRRSPAARSAWCTSSAAARATACCSS